LIDLSTCGPASANAKTILEVAPKYHSPYTEQISTSLERQLTKTTSLSCNLSAHLWRSPDGHARRQRLSAGNIFLWKFDIDRRAAEPFARHRAAVLSSEGLFKQNQLIININARVTPKLNLSGFYNFTSVHSNTGTASNSYNLMQDYRRAGFASPNMIFLMGNYMGPFKHHIQSLPDCAVGAALQFCDLLTI
jgi:hypothetical protein